MRKGLLEEARLDSGHVHEAFKDSPSTSGNLCDLHGSSHEFHEINPNLSDT